MPLFPWSSQARGFFTPRFDAVSAATASSVAAVSGNQPSDDEMRRCWFADDNFQRRARAVELAERRGVSPINIALAYVLNQPFPCFALVGPRTLAEDAQLAGCLGRRTQFGRAGLARSAQRRLIDGAVVSDVAPLSAPASPTGVAQRRFLVARGRRRSSTPARRPDRRGMRGASSACSSPWAASPVQPQPSALGREHHGLPVVDERQFRADRRGGRRRSSRFISISLAVLRRPVAPTIPNAGQQHRPGLGTNEIRAANAAGLAPFVEAGDRHDAAAARRTARETCWTSQAFRIWR